jgi:hypothetical protein
MEENPVSGFLTLCQEVFKASNQHTYNFNQILIFDKDTTVRKYMNLIHFKPLAQHQPSKSYE